MTPKLAIALGGLLGFMLIAICKIVPPIAMVSFLIVREIFLWFRECVRRYPEELDREARL